MGDTRLESFSVSICVPVSSLIRNSPSVISDKGADGAKSEGSIMQFPIFLIFSVEVYKLYIGFALY